MMISRARTLATVSAAVALTITCSIAADAQDRVRWKMQSAFGSNLSHLGTAGVRFTENMERVSDGSFQIEFFEPGALVPALECFDAAAKGSVESCWTTPGYHTGKVPALASSGLSRRSQMNPVRCAMTKVGLSGTRNTRLNSGCACRYSVSEPLPKMVALLYSSEPPS